MFFNSVWVHFWLPTSIVYGRDSNFFGKFWSSLWGFMDTKLNKSTVFHPHTDGQIELENRTVVNLLRGYCSKHLKLQDEQLQYVHHAYNCAIHSSPQRSPFETCIDTFLSHLWIFLLRKQVKWMDKMMSTKLRGSFIGSNRYIRQYKNNWRRAKPSTRWGIASIKMVISSRLVIRCGYISVRRE